MGAFVFVDWRRSAADTVGSASSSRSSELPRRSCPWNGNAHGSPPIERSACLRSQRRGTAAAKEEGKDRPCPYDDAQDGRSVHGGASMPMGLLFIRTRKGSRQALLTRFIKRPSRCWPWHGGADMAWRRSRDGRAVSWMGRAPAKVRSNGFAELLWLKIWRVDAAWREVRLCQYHSPTIPTSLEGRRSCFADRSPWKFLQITKWRISTHVTMFDVDRNGPKNDRRYSPTRIQIDELKSFSRSQPSKLSSLFHRNSSNPTPNYSNKQ